MNHRLFLYVLLSVGTCMTYFFASKSHNQLRSFQENEKSLQIFLKEMCHSSEECIIITDLHDVLLTRIDGDFERFRKLNTKDRLIFLKKLSKFGLNYFFYLLGTSKKPALEKSIIQNCLNQEQFKNFIKLISPYVLNEKISHFYKLSFIKGVKIVVFSNIGVHSYQYFKDKYPHAFDHLHFVETNAEKNNYTLKPDCLSYEILCDSLRTINNGTMPKTILYLDDRSENLEAFTNYLNTAKIKECLFLPYLFTSLEDFEKHYSLALLKSATI